MSRSDRTPRLRRAACVVCGAAALALAACGGGVYLSIGDDDFDDGRAPSVQLAADRSSAAPGDTVTLIAAASDASGIDGVEFFRVAPAGAAQRLGTDEDAPYRFSATVPADAQGSVSFYARATDRFGDSAVSATVSVTVVR